MHAIPFNRPHLTGNELDYIREAVANLHLSGNGPFTKRCGDWICERTGAGAALLTHSARRRSRWPWRCSTSGRATR